MPIRQKALAFLSGFLLFAALTYVSGYLAAVVIPRSYFEYFGRQHLTLALVIEEAIVIALPLFLLSVAWAYLSLRPMRVQRSKAMLSCLAGLLVAQAAFDIYLLRAFIEMPVPDGGQKVPVLTFVFETIFPWSQPWAYLNVLAAPAGIVVASLLLGGNGQSRPSASTGSTETMLGA